MEPLLVITICLVLSLILGEIFNWFKVSSVVGLIVAGVILGMPFFDILFAGGSGIDYIKFLSSLGIIFLLFISGLEADFQKLKSSRKDETVIAVLASIIPFGLGFLAGNLLNFNLLISFVLGAALSITSAGTTVVALMECKKLKTKIGSIILGAGIIDDVFEVIFLSLLIIFVHQGTTVDLAMFPVKMALFVLVVLAFFKIILPRLIRHSLRNDSQLSSLGLIIVMCFLIASLSSFLGLGQVIGAFIAGLLIQLLIKNEKVKKKIVSQIKSFSFAVIIPFFFIYIGLNLEFSNFYQNIWVFLLILGIAVVGKLGASFLAKFFTKLSFRQLHIIGWGMNSRGAVELVIIEVARNAGILPLELYTMLVVVAVLTTMIFPFVLRYYVKKYPDVMDE